MQCHNHPFLVSVWRFCKVPDGKIRMINGRRLYSFDSRHSSLWVWDIAGCMFSKPADFLQTQTVITNCTMRNPDTSRHIIQGVSKKGSLIWEKRDFQACIYLFTACLHLYTVWAKLIKGWCWAIFRQIEAQSSLHESSSLYQKNYWQISLQLPAGRIKTNQTKFASRHSQILLQNLSQFISIVIIYWEKLYILMYRIIKVLDINVSC